MNKLEEYLLNNTDKWDEFDAMDELQDAGIVSDECVLPEEVADTDCEKAVAWLKENA